MGKRITQQARGKGSLTFRVRRKAYRYRISYPSLKTEGQAKIIKLFNSPGHSAPLAKIQVIEKTDNLKKDKRSQTSKLERTDKSSPSPKDLKVNNKTTFIVPAADGVYEGQEIWIGKRPENKPAEKGDVIFLKDIAQGTKVFNIESIPGSGGRYLRTSGSSGIVMAKDKGKVEVIIKRRRIKLYENCRAVIGVVAGEGRKMKPLVKAGKKHHLMKSIGRKWHRTSAVKVNAIDHPFGGGRGKRIKSKIAKRNAPPGLKVGHIRPRKTGKRK